MRWITCHWTTNRWVRLRRNNGSRLRTQSISKTRFIYDYLEFFLLKESAYPSFQQRCSRSLALLPQDGSPSQDRIDP